MDDWYDSLDHTVPELLRRAADAHPDMVYVNGEDGEILTFRATLEAVEQMGAALLARGIVPGDRVAIWGPNSQRWIVAALASESIGAVMVPLNTRFKAAEAAYILNKSGARALFASRNFLRADYVAMLRDAFGGAHADGPVSGLPHLALAIALDAEGEPGVPGWRDMLSPAVDLGDVRAAMDAVTPERTCDIMFTSGTTGRPKGAMHSHGQAIWMPGIWNRSNDLQSSDRMLIANPFFHSFGYRAGWVSALLAGMPCYPVATFDVDQVLAVIEREKISVLMGPPTLFSSILDHPRRGKFDLSSLRVGHTGSSNIAVALIESARDNLAFELFLTSYGLTETTALVTVCWPGDDAETIARTVGRPIPGVEVRIVDASGQAVAPGESGELLVRGPNVMQGYFKDEEATNAAIDPAGWLATGDVAAMGADGTLRILDRLKDIVIVGGFNAYPAEIEQMLSEHPAIREAAVVAIPDARMGEVAGACVVLGENQSLTLEELAAWARERMANFKVPRHLFLLDRLPRTPLGKVQKFKLREQAVTSLSAPKQ